MKVLNAEGKIMGRIASKIAEESRDQEIHVVNSEKVVLSGKSQKVKDDYQNKHQRGSRHDGPYFPKRPDRVLKRTVKGMLPTSKKDGEKALSNVKTYIGVPDHLEEELEEPEVKEGDQLKHRNYVKLGEVSRYIGWER